MIDYYKVVNEVIDKHNRLHNANFHIQGIVQGIEREKFCSILTILLERLSQESQLKENYDIDDERELDE